MHWKIWPPNFFCGLSPGIMVTKQLTSWGLFLHWNMQSKAPKKLLWKRLSILAPFTGKKKKNQQKRDCRFWPKIQTHSEGMRVPSQTTTEMASRPGTTLSAYKSSSLLQWNGYLIHVLSLPSIVSSHLYLIKVPPPILILLFDLKLNLVFPLLHS